MFRYGFEIELSGFDVDEAVEVVTGALAEEGFGVLTTIDVQATFKKKLDVDFRPYRILGACNPQLARHAIDLDRNIGLLLPCNIIVEGVDGGARVAIADPKVMMEVTGLPDLEPVAHEADERLQRVAARLRRVDERRSAG